MPLKRKLGLRKSWRKRLWNIIGDLNSPNVCVWSVWPSSPQITEDIDCGKGFFGIICKILYGTITAVISGFLMWFKHPAAEFFVVVVSSVCYYTYLNNTLTIIKDETCYYVSRHSYFLNCFGDSYFKCINTLMKSFWDYQIYIRSSPFYFIFTLVFLCLYLLF